MQWIPENVDFWWFCDEPYIVHWQAMFDGRARNLAPEDRMCLELAMNAWNAACKLGDDTCMGAVEMLRLSSEDGHWDNFRRKAEHEIFSIRQELIQLNHPNRLESPLACDSEERFVLGRQLDLMKLAVKYMPEI